MFIGRYQHTVDPKGRVSIPARYGNALAQYEGNLIVVPNGQALEVYPYPEWERLVAAINDQSRFDAEARTLGRLYLSRAKEVELAAAGRVLLPPDPRRPAGPVQDGTALALGRAPGGVGGPRARGARELPEPPARRGRPRHRGGARDPARPRHLLVAARGLRARLLLPGRRAPRHAARPGRGRARGGAREPAPPRPP